MKKSDILKKLLPGFLPLFVFIIADAIFDTTIGLIVAVCFGFAEFIFTYIKEKRIDKFIIADTALLTVLGLVSILLDDDIFFKLKPAIIELIMCFLIGISVFSSKNLVFLMSQRYMKNISFNDNQIAAFNRSLKILFFIFSAHTLLIIYSAYFMSKEAWIFISGGLFYILFGVYFAYEFISNRLKMNKFKNEEWLPIVDDKGNVTRKAPRSACHKDKLLLHPVVHVHIFNNKGQIYLQKRPLDKLVQPGKWDTAVGGHIVFGETLELSLQRETEEELGIKDIEPKLLKVYKWESKIESELIYMFTAKYNKEIEINKDELDDGRFWSIREIKKNLGKNIFTSNFEHEFDLLVQLKSAIN